ncbi:MAG: glycosyltransferase [Candidatus Taylorbacteria bacterium]|nr:glycosyltransferase [Candidatus Taylorbacteria bacterium]
MRVLTIGTDRKLFEEGSAVRARVLEYGKLFDELHVVVFNNRFNVKDSRLKVEQIAPNCWIYPTNSWSRWFYVSGAFRIGRRILSKSFTLNPPSWVIDSQDPFECGLVAKKLSVKFKIPLQIQIHTDFLSPYFTRFSFLNWLRVRIARKVLPSASAIRVVSQRIKDSLATYKPQLTTKITVLPIFTNIKKFADAEPTFDLKQKYPHWSFVMLAVGRFTQEKNFIFALEVLKETLKKYPKTGLVIVGDGPLKDNLARQVNFLGLANNVVFEPWQNDLTSYYKTANLFLQTSFYEGFGLVLLEALASGCPAVSSDVGIASELLNHKGHSFVCSVNDLECFCSKIYNLIEDNQLRMFFSTQISPSVIMPFIQSEEGYLGAYKSSVESAVS